MPRPIFQLPHLILAQALLWRHGVENAYALFPTLGPFQSSEVPSTSRLRHSRGSGSPDPNWPMDARIRWDDNLYTGVAVDFEKALHHAQTFGDSRAIVVD